MQLPQETSSFQRRVRYGRYVAARLRRARKSELVDSAMTATAEVLAKGRAWENALFDLQDFLAERDGVDGELDATARQSRLTLASGDLDATKKAPYTAIFPKGIGYYTAATLPDQTTRYNELIERFDRHLAEDHPIRTDTAEVLRSSLGEYGVAVDALKKHRRDIAMASTDLTIASEDWGRVMERIYGLLVADIGRNSAEDFFPRVQSNT